MPYILSGKRPSLDLVVDSLRVQIETPGDLAYVLFKFLRKKAASWTAYCTWTGTVFLTLMEFYKSDIGVYEDGKRAANGDVE